MRIISKSIDDKIHDRSFRKMKKLKFFVPLLAMVMSFQTMAWEKITPDVYSIYGTKISESTNQMSQIAELVYNRKQDAFGVSFINQNGERSTIDYGIFRIRNCDISAIGAVAGPILREPASDYKMDVIFKNCDRPMYFRIWDMSNNYTIYQFDNVGPLKD